MQVLIIVNGGHGGRLMELKPCVSDSLQMAIDSSEKANWSNMTIPVRGAPNSIGGGEALNSIRWEGIKSL